MAINKSYHLYFKEEREEREEREKETEHSPQNALQWLLNLQPMQ